jgi:flavin reductase (DIM6/NTAB) family NADH-FMN oxidoreductase RutF
MDAMIKRQVLRMIPHGLQIVTLRDGDELHGYTSSWMTQVSFKPPLLVLGVRAESRSRRMMERSGVFCIHFLGKDQQDVAQSFFKPAGEAGDKLAGFDHRPGLKTGCPILENALAHVECKVVEIHEAGDHAIVIAEVLDCGLDREGEPLQLSDTPWQYGG